ncbi:lipid A-modifier LpxR family protein [Flavitalea flava]
MKQILPILLLFLFFTGKNDRLYAQVEQDTTENKETTRQNMQDAPTRLLRIYEDNDFINIYGKGTDNAYTNGTRIDLFYTKKHPSRFFIDRFMPKAGDSSVNVFGWGIMQIMLTPNDIAVTERQSKDYPYSGALFATHTLYSYDPVKKYDFQTELILGVMGPASMAQQLQTWVHRIINYQRPMGWGNQLGTDILMNVNFTAEKQLVAWRSMAPYGEVIGGGQAFFGTMLNGAAVYTLIRIGIMNPYFDGFMSQYNNRRTHNKAGNDKVRINFVIKPEVQMIFTNALLQGALFTGAPGGKNPGSGGSGNKNGNGNVEAEASQSNPGLHRMVYSINYGIVVSSGRLGVSFIQSSSSPMMKGLYDHTVGNISLYYGW